MPSSISSLLQIDPAAIDARWERLARRIEARFDRQISIESALFMVGIQARGRGYEPKKPKEDKQDLVMEGTYRVFETLGLYERVVTYQNGRTVWQKKGALPAGMSLEDQEKVLRIAILAYFEDVWPDLKSPASILPES